MASGIFLRTMRSLPHPRRLPALIVTVAAVMAPAAAQAASVSATSGSLSYAAASGETNEVTIAPWGLALKVTESGTRSGGKHGKAITLDVGTGCWKLSPSSAACAVPADGIQVEAGDGADHLDASALTTTTVDARGGAGDDVVTTGAGADTLDGGDGADTLSAGAGDDSIQARDGAADRIVCGGGSDSGLADATDTMAADCESVLPPPGIVDPNPGPVDPGPATDPDDPAPGADDTTDPDPSSGSHGSADA